MTQRRDVQQEIDFTRSEQLGLRRDVVLPPGEKFVLWILDDHIGRGRSWVMSMAQLQAESGYGKTSTYSYVNALADRGLVWWNELPDKRREFFICWTNMAEMIDEGTRADHESDREASSRSEHPSSPDEQLVRVANSSVRQTNDPVRVANAHIRNSAPLSAPISAPPRPLSAPQEETGDDDGGELVDLASQNSQAQTPDRESILRELQACGIDLFVQCLELAESRGVTLQQAGGVVEWYRRHPGRWPPGVLFERLTKPEARFLEASDGWFGETAAWKAQAAQRAARSVQGGNSHDPQTPDPERVPGEPSMPAIERDENVYRREARYGPKLDAMTPAEVDALLADRPTLLRQVKRNGLKSPLFRPTVLEILETKLTAPPRQLSLLEDQP